MNETVQMTAPLRVRCCVCHRERTPSGWRRLPQHPKSLYSHTYCPTCFDEAMAEVHAYIRSKDGTAA